MFLGDIVFNPEVQHILRQIGTPYWWGKGSPGDHWPPVEGVDCSGWAQMVLCYLGLLKRTEPDRSAYTLAMICTPVTVPALGDLCFYGDGITHVTVYLANGWTIGANGGSSKTKGDNPTAYVQIKPVSYRDDFVVFGRIKREYRPSGFADDLTPPGHS